MAFVALSSSAQFFEEDDERAPLQFGAEVSLGFMSNTYSSVFGMGISGLVDYNFNDTWFVHSGLGLYKAFGNGVDDDAGYSYYYDSEYYDSGMGGVHFQIPVHIGARIPIGDYRPLFVHVGPALGFDTGGSFSMGFGGRIGYELDKVVLSLDSYNAFTGNPYHNMLLIGVAYSF